MIREDAVAPPRIRIMRVSPTLGSAITKAKTVHSSVHSNQTRAKLKISVQLMRKILTAYKVDPAFLHVLFSFGEVPNLAESGSRNVACNTTRDGSHSEYKVMLGSGSFLTQNRNILSIPIRGGEPAVRKGSVVGSPDRHLPLPFCNRPLRFLPGVKSILCGGVCAGATAASFHRFESEERELA